MVEIDTKDYQSILTFLNLYRRGRRFYNLTKTKQRELIALIEKLKTGETE